MNAKRHTQKMIAYLMLYNGIAGCTTTEHGDYVLELCKKLLDAELDPKKREKTRVRAAKITNKMFNMAINRKGSVVISAICLCINSIVAAGYDEMFAEGEAIADIFDEFAAKCEPDAEAEELATKWLEILQEEF